MTFLVAMIACRTESDQDTVLRWSRRHETTFASAEIRLRRLLGTLPSLPGDTFACTSFTLPPGTTEKRAKVLTEALCRQQEAQWHAARHQQEEELGVAFLNTTFQHYGVVGVDLSIVGPDGKAEWSDHRGIWSLAEGVPAAEGVAYAGVPEGGDAGVAVGPAQLGWGKVDLALATVAVEPEAAELRPALEWRKEIPWHKAKGVARVFLLADGTPDAEFVQEMVR